MPPEKPPPPPADERAPGPRLLGALLRVPFEAINAEVNAALRAAGFDDIRPAHQSVFQHLPAAGARITELAERAQITKQSMGALVAHLEAGGYLERAADPRDGRAVLVRRSERGWAVEAAARRAITDLQGRWADELGAERFEELRALLRELAAVVEGA